MRMSRDGYLRPAPEGLPEEIENAESIFDRACPGLRVRANGTASATPHALLGSYVAVWEAWATDSTIRYSGSSGGVLTALNAWLVDTGRASRVIGAGADARSPRRSVPVTITTRDEALSAAGSRYAPVAALANPEVLSPGTAITAKPCEVAAARAAGTGLGGNEVPLLLSFFCAGTPSQRATDELLLELGVGSDEPLDEMRYRGQGWPGNFSARTGAGVVEADYESSWGSVLGPTVQWRCKICPDGVGESADVVAADSWVTDERGYPKFAESQGVSALVARTERGREAVLAAVEAGVIALRPLTMESLADAQPLQTARRRFLLARLTGAALAGRRPPVYTGFGLARLALRHPRVFVRVMRGTYRRARAARGAR